MELNTQILADGTVELSRIDGEIVGQVKPRNGGYWVNLEDAYNSGWGSMPVRSLLAGKYLILAAAIETDAGK